VLRMGVVREAKRVGPDLLDERQRLVRVAVGDRPALAHVVLVHRHAVQRDALSVQREASFGIEGHLADADSLRDAVDDGAAVEHFDLKRVQVRFAHALPEVRRRDADV